MLTPQMEIYSRLTLLNLDLFLEYVLYRLVTGSLIKLVLKQTYL